MTHLNELFSTGFGHPPLKDWMDWVAGNDPDCFVALPLIQRGAVWKPKQIITLWDSLLRGMPIGSLMVSELKPESNGRPVKVRRVGSNDLISVPPNGGVALIDGQQRTFAVLLGWLQGDETSRLLGRQVWVDFADKPAQDHLFRLHVTTSAQRHGFTKADPNARLSLSERRAAKDVLGNEREVPWHSVLPLPLAWLIHEFQKNQDTSRWTQAVLNELQQKFRAHRGKGFADLTDDERARVLKAVGSFAQCLEGVFMLRIPLIKIPDACFQAEGQEDGDDPALAILFKRVGTGGTELSDADYAYAVIKHYLPQSFELVEKISAIPGLSRLLGPLDIVMTAVRLVAVRQGLTDFESPTKSEFDRLRRDPKPFFADFLNLVESDELARALEAITHALVYRDEDDDDIGLPREGLVLISRPVLQVMLRWLLGQPLLAGDTLQHRAEQSRAELIRFALYAHLAMPDHKRASEWAFEYFKEHCAQVDGSCGVTFPGKELVRALMDKGKSKSIDIAWMLPTVGEFAEYALSDVRDPVYVLRGGERFRWDEQNPSSGLKVFRRWWGQGGYHHPLLLWLQRSYIHRLSSNAQEVRYDDETLYDYDHILPHNHFANWTGHRSSDRLLDFLAIPGNAGHWAVGNSIGNLRVWYASDNRSDGDQSAADKITPKDGMESGDLIADSAIASAQWKDWQACSNEGQSRVWDADRARAFQSAVEQRTLDLYTQYVERLNFQSWFPADEEVDLSTKRNATQKDRSKGEYAV